MHEQKLSAGLAHLAEGHASPELGGTIRQASAAGVSIFSILIALATHAGDIQAIIAALLKLIGEVNPPAAEAKPV